MSDRHGGHLLMECLVALGASKGFGVPGESYLAVLDGMYDARDRFDLVLCRNEGGAAFMAAAYGKLTGQPGLCFVTRGPGATNASIGVHTAMQDSVPMILFVGQIDTGMRDREAFQEIDYRAFFGPIAKWATEIDDVDRIPEIMSRAWTTATSGRPGPVIVALPEDMLASMTNTRQLESPVRIEPSVASDASIASACKLIASAARPVILMGGASWTADQSRALKAFAETSDIPVVAAFRYQDQFDNHSPAYVGDAGVGMLPAVRQTLDGADLILALGVRFGEMTTDGFSLFELPQMAQTLIHVHSSDRELGKIYQPDLAIHASPGLFVEMLARQSITGDWSDWRAARRAAYE
ncbi:MAG: thiamine pyrophosphate-binding protein, partial [Acidimicrobiia bacterium]|nr:thiamine pyrophosphate-binding protein [Acidimicrobiia bacterium]